MELNLVGLDDAAPPLPRRAPPAGRRDRGGRGRDRDGGRGRGRGRGGGRGANDRPPSTAPPARPAPAAAAAKGYEADLRPTAATPPRPSTGGRPAEAPAHRPPAGRGAAGGGGGGGAVPAKRPPPPPPADDDDALHASDSEADDVAAVLTSTRAKDAALEADLAAAAAAAAAPARRRPVGGDGGSSSDSDSGGYGGRRGGVVSFVDETKTLRPATKRARKEGGAGAAAAAPTRAAAPAQPRRGELVRAGVAPAVGGAAGDTFEGVGLDPSLAAHLAKSGFERPTRVQAATIPALLARRDALVRAPTGSGKTLAYAAPIMQCLAGYSGPGAPPPPRVPRSAGTRAVVILPTRELALQVGDVLATLARRYHWIVPGVLYGGESRSSEKARLRKGVAALAATPGRLLDHLENTAALAVDALEWLVLDEADRLLDLGMEAKVASILGQLRRRGAAVGGGGGDDSSAPPPSSSNRRVATVLLSATMSAAVAGLGGVALVDPARVGDVGGGDGGSEPAASTPAATAPPSAATGADVAATVSHAALVVPARARLAAVAALILRHAAAGHRVLAFCSSCDGVEGAHALLTRGVSAARERGRGRFGGGDSDDDGGAPPGLLPPPALLLKLHGGMPQAERSAAFLAFSRAKGGAALVATDVAARGLDFPSLAAVVHADAPASVADYCHRAGRAGRAGAAGASVLVLTPAEAGFCGVLADAGVPPPARADARAALAPLDDLDLPPPPPLNRTPRFADEFDGVRALGAALVGATARDAELRAAAEAGFRGAVRAYATYPAALKPHFHIKKMHLGHVAHAWGLKEAPSVFGGRHEGKSKKKK